MPRIFLESDDTATTYIKVDAMVEYIQDLRTPLRKKKQWK